MNLRTDSLFPLAVLAMLTGLAVWLEHAIRTEAPRADGKSRHDPDGFVEHFTMRRFDMSGKLQHSMSAEKMVHFPDDDSTEVTRPRLTYHTQTPNLHVSAQHAEISKDGVVAVLTGDVVVLREAARDTPELRFSTSRLTVRPNDETATTDEPVRLVQGKSIVTGTGLDFDNRRATVVIHANVRATIDRKPNKR